MVKSGAADRFRRKKKTTKARKDPRLHILSGCKRNLASLKDVENQLYALMEETL